MSTTLPPDPSNTAQADTNGDDDASVQSDSDSALDPSFVHAVPKLKSKKERLAAKGGKAGNQVRFSGRYEEFLSAWWERYEGIRAMTHGKVAALDEFWTDLRLAFWQKFSWKAVRNDVFPPSAVSLAQQDFMMTANKVSRRGTVSGICLRSVVFKSLKNYFSNRYNRTSGRKNPFTELLKDLRQQPGRKPRKVVAWQLWEKENGDEINRILQTQDTTAAPKVKFHSDIARERFKTLDKAVRDDYIRRADELTEAAKKEYADASLGAPSQDPADQAE